MKLQPLKMNPVFKEAIWGGTALRDVFGKQIVSDHTSESWEIAVHKNGESIIANGEFAGKPLGAAIDALGNRLLGDAVVQKYGQRFPLLVKLLDCCDKLSVQVHPNDAYANAHENGDLGKTEMWYVLDAKPGAKLVYGFAKDVTKQQFEQAIASGELESVLNYVEVAKGDCFFIPSGTLHALQEGLLIVEIQQNSDTTYRVYDYDRTDAQGRHRQLHVPKALEVTKLSANNKDDNASVQPEMIGDNIKTHLVKCEYFTVDRYDIISCLELNCTKDSFDILIFCEGSGHLAYDGGSIAFTAGDSFVIPAYLSSYSICGTCVVLTGRVPV